MVKLGSTIEMPRRGCSLPERDIEGLAPMPNNLTIPSNNSNEKDGSIPFSRNQPDFDRWVNYIVEVNTTHVRWVRNDPARRSGYVYVFLMMPSAGYFHGDNLIVKIGMSHHPERRIAEIRRSRVKMPYTIHPSFQFWSDDMAKAERLLHFLLENYRLDGEWFGLTPEIWEALDNLWYIHASSQISDGKFRDICTGDWHSPNGFFEYQFQRMQEETEGI